MGLAAFVPLAVELCDLKRVRDASSPESLATRGFRRAWGALVAGHDPDEVALCSTADALAACRLGGIDRDVLLRCGLSGVEAGAVLARSFDEVCQPVAAPLRDRLRGELGRTLLNAPVPDFAEALIHQPRAGATCPGKPRIVLEPPEGHGDHCFVVAALGAVLAPQYGASPGAAFLAGMAHHLHNAVLPDSGFAGEMLLGPHLEPVMERLFTEALATLPPALQDPTVEALAAIRDAETPVGRAFHAADVIDRVLEIAQHLEAARLTMATVLGDMGLVHDGPVKDFHDRVLAEMRIP